MRVGSWVLVSLGAGLVLATAWASLTEHDAVSGRLLLLAPVAFVVAVVWRVVTAAIRPGATVKQTVAPGVQGLDEVQAITLGRTFTGPVTFGNEQEPVAELVVDRHDPLDETTWTVGGA